MRKRFFPMRSLQIMLADVVTQKRQLNRPYSSSSDNNSPEAGDRAVLSSQALVN
jgi:hypothetical protein